MPDRIEKIRRGPTRCKEGVRLFRGAVHEAAALDRSGEVTKSCWLAEAEKPALTGMPISLEHGHRIEHRCEQAPRAAVDAGCKSCRTGTHHDQIVDLVCLD